MKKRTTHRSPAVPAANVLPFTPGNRGATEWIGARVALPGVKVRGHRGAVHGVVWLAGTLLVDMTPLPSRAERDALAQGLRRALANPNAPRPSSVRVADADEVPRVQAVLGPNVPVRVGPTPEIGVIVAQFEQAMTEGREAEPVLELVVLADKDPAAASRFFHSAAALYRTAPWDALPTDEDVLSVHAPSLGWNHLCVCIIGQAGENYGALWFESAADYTSFRAATEASARTRRAPKDIGAPFRAVSFERAADLPATLRQEFSRRGWPLAGPGAVPMLLVTERSGAHKLLSVDDLGAAATLCDVLARFFVEHGKTLRADMFTLCEGRYRVDGAGGHDVVVRYPHAEYRPSAEDEEEPAEDGQSLPRFMSIWIDAFEQRHAREIPGALHEMAYALLGRSPTKNDNARLEVLHTSFPQFWTSLWRPMSNGKTGLEASAQLPALAGLRAVRERLLRARFVYGEILSVNIAKRTVVVRDLFDGARLRVADVPAAQLEQYVRWMRVFGLVIPRDEESWIFPSVFVASPGFATVEPAALVSGVQQSLRELGGRVKDIDPTRPHAGLLRHAGVALSTLFRLERASASKAPPTTFLANSEGELVEFHDVEVSIGLTVGAVKARMASAEDFTSVDAQTWDRVDRARTEHTPHGESVGQLARVGRTWIVRGNSAGRVERMLDRLAILFGVRPVERARKVSAPWRTEPGIVRAPGEGTRTLVLASGPMNVMSEREARAAAEDLQTATMRRALDRPNEALGGVPRELVKTERGRASVEQWIREAEVMGRPNKTGESRLVDLDPLRVELGLPPVDGGDLSPRPFGK